MRYSVKLLVAHEGTVAVNGGRIRRTRKGVQVTHRGIGFTVQHFVPWDNVAYIRDDKREQT